MPFVLNAVTAWRDPDAGEAHVNWADRQRSRERATLEAA
jgi:hypothetical protein